MASYDVPYGYTRELRGTTFEHAVGRTTEALKQEGFGVLTSIDVKETLKKKLGVDFRRYVILGACNPNLAQRAFGTELGIGLLLPCNVTVFEGDEGQVVVQIIKPQSMFEVAVACVLAGCGGTSFNKIGCDPSAQSCSLACTSGTCQGSCGQSCSGTCSGGSNCTVTAGNSASLNCTGGATCSFTVGVSSSIGCTAATCHAVCTGACNVGCNSGSTCDLKCASDAQPHAIPSGGSCS